MTRTAERNELILYAVWDSQRGRHYVDVAEGAGWPPPEGARILCRIDREDRHLMLNWTIQLARRGLPLRKIRRACEGKKAPWKP